MVAVTVYDDDGETPIDWRLCLVPNSDYEIIDTWYAMGMAATGSKDIAVTDLFVPERRALPLTRTRGGLEHPGAALNTGPLFRVPIIAASSHLLAPAALGAAEGAYELFLDAMANRTSTYTGARVTNFQAVQIKVGRARSLIDSAHHLLRQSALAFQAAAERNETPDLETKLRFRAHAAFAVSQAREAIEVLWSCYGAQGLYIARPTPAALARCHSHQPALLVQLRHRWIGLRSPRARRRICQSDHVKVREDSASAAYGYSLRGSTRAI
jgi:3-hydroxy-9,10-secoandrosta-1,3,5(10)-triene-9,17-dione monooxygenase